MDHPPDLDPPFCKRRKRIDTPLYGEFEKKDRMGKPHYGEFEKKSQKW
jgi:hypothetical protein